MLAAEDHHPRGWLQNKKGAVPPKLKPSRLERLMEKEELERRKACFPFLGEDGRRGAGNLQNRKRRGHSSVPRN